MPLEVSDYDVEVREKRKEYIEEKLKERNHFVHESWVRTMEAKLVRDELNKCYKAEGVNHFENCKWLSEKYLGMLKDARIKGYKTIDTV